MMIDTIHVVSFLYNTYMLYLQVSWQQPSESACSPEARSPLLGPAALFLSSPPPPSHPLILLPVIATALKQTETIASEWISTSWIWPHGDSGNFPPRWVTPLQLPCNIYPDKQKARCAQEWLRGADGQTDGWMDGWMEGKREAASLTNSHSQTLTRMLAELLTCCSHPRSLTLFLTHTHTHTYRMKGDGVGVCVGGQAKASIPPGERKKKKK